MIKDSTRRTLRSSLQWTVSAAAAAPVIVGAAGLPESMAGGVGVGLAVMAGITRVMAVPAVDGLLPKWLRKTAPPTLASQNQGYPG